MARESKIDTQKLKDLNKELPKFGDVVREMSSARLHSYGGRQPEVRIYWNLNDDSIQDQIFKIKIGKEEAYLDWEEFLHFARAF